MQMSVEELEDGLKKVNLEGRLDIEGDRALEPKFTIVTSTRAERLVVDLSKVSFIASIGIRTLLTAARAQQNRGGKMVLLSPGPLVRKVLETAGVDRLVSIADDLDAARAIFAA